MLLHDVEASLGSKEQSVLDVVTSYRCVLEGPLLTALSSKLTCQQEMVEILNIFAQKCNSCIYKQMCPTILSIWFWRIIVMVKIDLLWKECQQWQNPRFLLWTNVVCETDFWGPGYYGYLPSPAKNPPYNSTQNAISGYLEVSKFSIFLHGVVSYPYDTSIQVWYNLLKRGPHFQAIWYVMSMWWWKVVFSFST